MTRLYWKIFLAFWVVIILTVAITVTVNSIVFRDEADSKRFNALRSSLEGLTERAQQVLDDGGEQGLRDWLQARHGTLPVPPLLIIDSMGRELLGRPFPRPLNPKYQGPNRGRMPRSGPGRLGQMQVHEIRGADGQSFRVRAPHILESVPHAVLLQPDVYRHRFPNTRHV